MVIWQAKLGEALTFTCRETYKYVLDESVEWSVCLFWFARSRKNRNRKREEKRKHSKLFDVNKNYEKWHKKSLEWEIKSSFGHTHGHLSKVINDIARKIKLLSVFVLCDKQTNKQNYTIQNCTSAMVSIDQLLC